MDNLLDVRLEGPFPLLGESETLNTVFTDTAAQRPGLFLWTFEVKQAHRLHFVDAHDESVGTAIEHLHDEYLAGMRALFRAERLADGEVEVIFGYDASPEEFDKTAALEHLRLIQVFYACPEIPMRVVEELRDALIERYVEFGESTSKWLEPGLSELPLIPAEQRSAAGSTVRFHRPAFIASLPDDMYL